MKKSIEVVLDDARREAGKPASYPFLPEIIESLEAIRDNPNAPKNRRVGMARALERLVMDNFAFSESPLGTAILEVANEFVEG